MAIQSAPAFALWGPVRQSQNRKGSQNVHLEEIPLSDFLFERTCFF